MRKNRIIYGIILIVLFWIMIMYDSWQTQFIFEVGIVVPVVVGSINFLMARKMKVYFDEQEEYCQKEDSIKKYIMVDNDTMFPAARIELKVEIVDYFGHKEKRIIVVNSEPYTIRNFAMDMLFHHYGIMTVRIKQIRVYDFFFLSVYKKKLNIETSIYIFPDFGNRIDFFIRSSRCGIEDDENEEFSTGKKGENRGDIVAIDEYHEGDDVRNIHWKLSSKSDELIVKHFGNTVDEKVHIHVDAFVDSEAKYESSDKILGVVYSLINTCYSENIPFDLIGYGENGACETDAKHLLRLIYDYKKENLNFSDIFQETGNTGTNIYITTKDVKEKRLPLDAVYINIQEQEEDAVKEKQQYFLENNTVLHLEVEKQKKEGDSFKTFLEPYDDKIRCHKKIKYVNNNFKYMALQSFIALLAAGMAVFSIYDVIFFEKDIISLPLITVSLFILLHFILNVIGQDMEEKKIGKIRNIVIFGGYLLILIFGGVFFVFDGVSNIIDAFGMDILVSEGDYGFFEYSSRELDWLLILITYAVADVIYNFCMEFVLTVHILIVVPLISISMIVGYVPPIYVVLFGLIYFPAIFAVHSCISFGKKKKHKYLSDDYPYTGNVAYSSGCITIIVTMAVFCLVTVHIFWGGYKRPVWMTQCKTVVNSILEEGNLKGGIRVFSDLFKKETVPASNARGELDDTMPVAYTGKLALTVDMRGGGASVQKGIYLKSFAGTNYEGDSWKERSNSEIKKEEEYLKNEFDALGYIEWDDAYLDIYFTEAAAFREKLAQYFARCQAMGIYYVTVQDGMNMSYNMEIQSHLKEDTNIYMPYFSRTETSGTIGGDGYEYFSKDDKEKTVEFSGYMLDETLNINAVRSKFGNYPYIPIELEDEYFAEEKIETMIALEKRYAEYVGQNYIEVPEQLEELRKRFSNVTTVYQGRELKLASGDYQYRTVGYEPYVQYIRRYFSENGFTYNINIVRKNENADFINDFMARKTGYCIHFASAAVMMFRSMGIPARYAEGYFADNECVVKSTGNTVTYNITDQSAHAWVEIYQEGLGWVPVEVTPGTENFEVNRESTALEILEQTSTSSNNNQQTSVNLKESASQNSQEITTAAIKQEQNSEENIAKPLSPLAKTLIKGILFLLAAIAVFLLRYQAVSRRKLKKLETGSKTMRLDEMERQLKEIFDIFKINIGAVQTNEEKAALLSSSLPEVSAEEVRDMLQILDKFRYAPKGSVEPEEVDKLYHFIQKYGQSMYGQGKVYEKFIYKYIKCLYLKNK